jgi:DNA-binding CsgD family transcriptional regulator
MPKVITPRPAAASRVAAPEPREDPLLAAVRVLVRAVRTGPVADTGDRRVLLDVEVDGVRCVLLRVPTADHDGVVLSPREQEIARMVAKGYPNKTIAAVLEISTWTVGTYLRRIFAKLGVGTRAAMVARLQNPTGYPREPGERATGDPLSAGRF